MSVFVFVWGGGRGRDPLDFSTRRLACPSHTAVEEKIAADEEAVLLIVEAHVARTVPRGMQDLEVDLAHGYDIAVVELDCVREIEGWCA